MKPSSPMCSLVSRVPAPPAPPPLWASAKGAAATINRPAPAISRNSLRFTVDIAVSYPFFPAPAAARRTAAMIR